MRLIDQEEGVVYWYHGISVDGEHERKLFTSEFGDDYDAVPMYEQIYALAGPVQTYRVTGDRRILDDAERTVALFDRFYRDRRTAATSRTSTRSCSPRSTSRSARTGRARTGTRFGDQRTGLPDQPVPGHRRGAVRADAGTHSDKPFLRSKKKKKKKLPGHHRQRFRTSRTARSCRSVHADWSHDTNATAGSRTGPWSGTT